MNWYVKEFAKLCLNILQDVEAFIGRSVGIIGFPTPPNSSMRKTGSKSIWTYYKGGLTTYLPLATLARYYGIKFDKNTKVLDFGCGVGRQLLHFVRDLPNAKYFACDVDKSSIAFMSRNYPTVTSYTSGFLPPLKYTDGELDLVYSVSTFSHFDLDTHRLWLKEFFRITKPGGLIFITIEGEYALPNLVQTFGSETQMREAFSSDGILYKEYSWLQAGKRHRSLSTTVELGAGLGDTYGNTIISPEFVYKNWGEFGFEILGIAPGACGLRQDIVVLRRPESRP